MKHELKTVAILIPCRNEEKYLARCLDSLLANDYDKNLLEIVVLDGMSTDRTREIIAEYSQKYPWIRMIENPQKNKPAALNLGIRSTHSDIVMRIDAHATYESQYISKLVKGLQELKVDNIGGVRETYLGEKIWEKAIGVVISHPFAVGNAYGRTGVSTDQPVFVDTVFCGCYPREVFDNIGYFNEKLIRTQDREFNARLIESGGKIILDPQTRCLYYPRIQFLRYVKWNFDGAFWVYYAKRFCDTKMRSWRNWIPPLFFLWHFMTLFIGMILPKATMVCALPIIGYWMLVSFFSLKVAWKFQSLLMGASLFVLFSVTHYSYGIGAIWGFLSALGRKKEKIDLFPSKLYSSEAA